MYRVAKNNIEGVFVDTLVIGITEKCTLNCRHCFAAVPYKKEPKSVSFQEFKEKIDLFITLFDGIRVLNISGGETMLHPDLYEMIQYATEKEEIKSVQVFTNGTLLANKEKVETLNRKKTLFYFSDYGKLAKNLKANADLMESIDFPYYIQHQEFWYEANVLMDFAYVEETPEQLALKYKKCIKNNCNALEDGYFMRCGMARLAEEWGTVPNEDLDRVDVDISKRPIAETKAELREYLKKEYLELCRYCPGRTLEDSVKVPVAEQVVGKLVWPEK